MRHAATLLKAVPQTSPSSLPIETANASGNAAAPVDRRPTGRRILLTDYERHLVRPIPSTVAESLAAIPDAEDETPKGGAVRHSLTIDCPDCGRGVAHRGNDGVFRCPKCGGSSWVPAGGVDRQAIKDIRNQLQKITEEVNHEVAQTINDARVSVTR